MSTAAVQLTESYIFAVLEEKNMLKHISMHAMSQLVLGESCVD